MNVTINPEKVALLQSVEYVEHLPAYKKEADVEEEEVIDKSLLLHLIVCTISVTLSLFFYGKLILKCITYLSANGTQIHQNTAISLLAGSVAVAAIVLGLFLHAVVQTLNLVKDSKKRFVNVISV
jgi:hypothetical protein